MRIPFDTIRGEEVFQYTITNGVTEADVLNYGGIIRNLRVPDRDGRLIDVVLGFDTVEEYDKSPTYFGALVGRVGNRIDKGRFSVNGKTYQVGINDKPNSLHGGFFGFNRQMWQVEELTRSSITLYRLSPDGEEGYPGNLEVSVTYTLTEENALRIEYKARCDQDTPINLTQHSFFNLEGEGTVLDHELMLLAERITPVDQTHITFNTFMDVKDTPFDFTEPKKIGKNIHDENMQLTYGKGYDINFVCENEGFRRIGTVYASKSGINMEIYTDQPGVQFYSGNYLDGVKGKQNAYYEQYAGFCLETQNYPNAVNCDAYPNMILSSFEVYHSKTEYKFCAK